MPQQPLSCGLAQSETDATMSPLHDVLHSVGAFGEDLEMGDLE
jgi:hypothetical protein